MASCLQCCNPHMTVPLTRCACSDSSIGFSKQLAAPVRTSRRSCRRNAPSPGFGVGKPGRCTQDVQTSGHSHLQTMTVTAPPPSESAAATGGQSCWGPCLASFATALALAALLLNARERKAAVRESPDDDLVVKGGVVHDSQHHQRVLAKTRQAAHIQSAFTYNKSGEVSKAILELNKALASNSICRSPALVTQSQEELADLYRLHLTYTEQPPNFAVLLQLQEMLGLSQGEAEKIEVAVLRSPGAFAI